MFGLSLGGPLATGDHSSTQVTPSPPPPVSEMDAKLYYKGQPSEPRLVARTGPPLEAPSGPEAYPRYKELRVVGNHEIDEVWDKLAPQVFTILDEKGVHCTSVDLVRFGYDDDPSGNVIIWIGVKPGSLSYEVGIDVALQCKKLLLDHDIRDVDVEIRESEVTR
jgi:hypothetical protein